MSTMVVTYRQIYAGPHATIDLCAACAETTSGLGEVQHGAREGSCEGGRGCPSYRRGSTITDEQIRSLRAEATAAGDVAQATLCDRAAMGDEDFCSDFTAGQRAEILAAVKAVAS